LGLIGTFGAFIRLRSPVIDRRQLLDVGAAGPWAGLVVSLVVLVWGLVLSQPLPNVPGPTEQLIYVVGFGGDRFPLFLGDSLLMSAAKTLLVGEGTILLHPLAAAGWFGLLVTMMNLMPLGQLDGGHVVYSLLGRHQSKVGFLMWIALVVMGFQFKIWWVWAALILVLGRGRISHPSVLDPYRPVPRSRWILGLATAVLFVLTFSVDPIPFG
jgi:membrane-associated protease RseP (regulator of RpoE activity)